MRLRPSLYDMCVGLVGRVEDIAVGIQMMVVMGSFFRQTFVSVDMMVVM